MRTIKNLQNNRSVIFDSGKFDQWCVYVVEENGFKKAPFDVDYFTDLQNLNNKYPNNKVYYDFISIYKLTDNTINPVVLNLIDSITNTYNQEDRIIVEQWFSVIYAGMIAEENKQFAILKKRVKHLGVYQTLIQGMNPADAARFSYGKKWRELDAIMKPLGI
ncbi:hypothetical protein NJB85_17325 [Myroides odoratimimus]|uniref:DUF7004 family protein n=1 Tax=Myroides odoratimimus TaxID=76832 RepID=UPI002096AF01|nr:hypothetical protein [Myroides odoratimimus]MCO7724924.1 hypothetical protein [Myroides odoratimimus]